MKKSIAWMGWVGWIHWEIEVIRVVSREGLGGVECSGVGWGWAGFLDLAGLVLGLGWSWGRSWAGLGLAGWGWSWLGCWVKGGFG